MAASCLNHFAACLMGIESTNSPSVANSKQIFRISNHNYRVLGSLSMNGDVSDCRRAPLGTIETRAFPVAPTLALAVERLNSAIFDLESRPPPCDSGILRLEVPILQHIQALDWLRSQNHSLLPRCYFSCRGSNTRALTDLPNGNGYTGENHERKLISVAGLGSAVFFQSIDQFSLRHWYSIKRFLSENSPLIRAYGAIRFDAKSQISSEWNAFGSFYFMVPQVEFDEFEGNSMVAATVAWDNSLSRTYTEAIAAAKGVLWQISPVLKNINGYAPHVVVLHQTDIPDKISWDLAVNQALDSIKGKDSKLVKVVLGRCRKLLTKSDVDPLMLLPSLKVGGDMSYRFCLQPPESPAFIGNTPEQLFHRHQLSIFSEAMAATRARGETDSLDIEIGRDLLSSSKDHHEFDTVREYIKRKLEAVCSGTVIASKKTLWKLPRVQHLYATLTGTLQNEDDEFKILSSLHPTPAVCGFPMEEARVLISKSEIFDRGMYAGPVGWFGGKESEFAVGIRSALVGKGVGALLYAGTGIVDGSNPSLEWQELELKISQFTRLMEHNKVPLQH